MLYLANLATENTWRRCHWFELCDKIHGECLASFICSQNSNIPRIKQMVASVARLGKRIGDQDWAYEFPAPETVADAGEGLLRSVGLGYRAKHLALTAHALTTWEDGELEDLRRSSYEAAKDALMDLQGVGPKVADCVLAYSLDKGEAFPIDVPRQAGGSAVVRTR